MVCIRVYTSDDAPFWNDTHCVLGLDDNGKVGACEWNHLQRADQFLISSVCYEKKQLNIHNSVTKPQDGPLQYSNLEMQASIKQLSSLGVNVKWNEKLDFSIQVIHGQFLLYDHSISSHLVAKPNSQESKPFKQIKQWKIIPLDMHAYK